MNNFHSRQTELVISFAKDVVTEMQKYRQTAGRKEAGGLLFSEAPNSNHILITHASLPNRFDIRKWSLFKIHVHRARRKIAEQFELGRHYVGEWHTHSQREPRPSEIDKKTISALFTESDHELNYLIMTIVSSTTNFSKSYVALADGNSLYRCEPGLSEIEYHETK